MRTATSCPSERWFHRAWDRKQAVDPADRRVRALEVRGGERNLGWFRLRPLLIGDRWGGFVEPARPLLELVAVGAAEGDVVEADLELAEARRGRRALVLVPANRYSITW
jgi:hypothetical protein